MYPIVSSLQVSWRRHVSLGFLIGSVSHLSLICFSCIYIYTHHTYTRLYVYEVYVCVCPLSSSQQFDIKQPSQLPIFSSSSSTHIHTHDCLSQSDDDDTLGTQSVWTLCVCVCVWDYIAMCVCVCVLHGIITYQASGARLRPWSCHYRDGGIIKPNVTSILNNEINEMVIFSLLLFTVCVSLSW